MCQESSIRSAALASAAVTALPSPAPSRALHDPQTHRYGSGKDGSESPTRADETALDSGIEACPLGRGYADGGAGSATSTAGITDDLDEAERADEAEDTAGETEEHGEADGLDCDVGDHHDGDDDLDLDLAAVDADMDAAPAEDTASSCDEAEPLTPLVAPPAHKTTAILDWDDTICPSTYLAGLGLRVDDRDSLPAPLAAQLQGLEDAVIHIMREALRFGAVVVITNAEAGWVELSGRRFMPAVVDFITDHGIRVVSARTCFELDYPDAPSSWKVAAFSHEVATMYPHEDRLNVLVLGDSMSERDAAHALGTRMPHSKVKTVKFVERPSIDQLMRQVQLVAQSLPDLASYSSSFDVDLVVSC
jgi:hypothetical protein